MVNGQATTNGNEGGDRRERTRAAAAQPTVLGLVNANPFGDLHTVQHLTARLARALKPVFEGFARTECRTFAEPLAMQRFAEYRAERGDRLSAWVALPGMEQAPAQLVIGGDFVLELLDLFFGGTGTLPAEPIKEFSPAAIALVDRVAGQIVPALGAAWEPVVRIDFGQGPVETNPSALAGVDPDDALVVTRIGVARGDGKPAFVDIVYPVAALKPHGEQLTRKVHGRPAEVAPEWRQNLTRAVMNVAFPVRTVLAEPVIPLTRLLSLKVGDVIPIGLGEQVPVMVGNDRLGTGTVGTSNGKAAIQLNQFALLEGPRQ